MIAAPSRRTPAPARLLLLALALLPGCPSQAAGPHLEHGAPEERIARYEDAARAEWQKPDEVVRALGLAPDATVVDLGAGSGYFAVRLARACPSGRVLALDVEPAFAAHLTERARREGLSNLAARVVSPADPALEPGSVDLVLLVDVYHHLDERARYLEKLAAGLAPGGRIAIVDFRPGSSKGPPRDHKVARETVLEEARGAGLRLGREHDFLPEQYFLELAAGP